MEDLMKFRMFTGDGKQPVSFEFEDLIKGTTCKVRTVEIKGGMEFIISGDDKCKELFKNKPIL